MVRANRLQLCNSDLKAPTLIDTFIEELGGVLFANTFTPAPDTPRSIAAFFTGRDPELNGCDKFSKWPLYYLNKEWNSEWGGQTIVGNKEVDYVPNRAVVYKTNVRHGGKSGTGSLFRTYINYVVTK